MIKETNPKIDYDVPPKYWKYEDEIIEDVGNYFQRKDGSRLPIVKVWEDGSPLYEYSYQMEKKQRKDQKKSKLSLFKRFMDRLSNS